MRTRTGRRIGRSGVALLLVLTSLILHGSARADSLVTLGQQYRINRLTIGLLQRGQNISDVLDFDVLLEGCAANVRGACIDVYQAAKRVGLSTDNLVLSVNSAEGPVGAWSIFESFGGTSGSLTITDRNTGNAAYVGTATFTGGTVRFAFYSGGVLTDDLDRYDFTYDNSNGDRGFGYFKWTPNGCALIGPFISQVFKGANGLFNTGILVLQRC